MPCSIQSSAGGIKATVEAGKVATSSPAVEDPHEEGNSLSQKMGKGDLVAPPVLHKQNQRIDGQPKQILSCWRNICLKNNVVVTQNITLADASLLLFAFLTVSHFLCVTVREAKNVCLQRIFRATVWGVLVSWRLVYTWCDSTLIRSAYKRIADHDF